MHNNDYYKLLNVTKLDIIKLSLKGKNISIIFYKAGHYCNGTNNSTNLRIFPVI